MNNYPFAGDDYIVRENILLSELKSCLELLQKIEWIYSHWDDRKYCSCCHNWKEDSHAKDCILAKRIANLEKLVEK